MPQPPAYNRTKDFTENFGTETDHASVNAEFDKVSNSINDVRTNLAILQADDGKLRPAVVTPDSLSADLADFLTDSIRMEVNDARAAAVAAAAEASAARDAVVQLGAPANGTVTDVKVAAGSALANRIARPWAADPAHGALGDGAADDAAAIASAITSSPLLREYRAASYSNNFGHNVTPDGVVVHATTRRVFNPRKHKYMHTFGAEVLQHWFGLFALDSNTVVSGDGAIKKIVVSGDSVTYGYGNTTGVPSNILNILAARRGYKNVQVVNRGQSGKSCHEWVSGGFLTGDLAENPDLLILGWGDNDFGQGYTAAQLLAKYREALTTIRASKTVSQMSIILRMPTSMTDVTYNRTEYQLERVIEGFKQLARDFQCAFVDTYSLFQNSHDAAGKWMDNDGGNAIHPLDVMQEHVWAAVAELALPDYGADWQNNGVYNYSAGTQSRNASDAPNTYFDGITMVRSGGAAPFDGIFCNIKQADSAVLQLHAPLYGVTSGYGIAARLGFNNNFGPWLGEIKTPALENGWTQQPSAQAAGYYFTLDGTVVLQGAIKAGTTADQTQIFVLPDGYRPAANVVCLVPTENGFGRLLIEPSGAVKALGVAGNSYIYLNGAQFRG